MPVFAAGPLRFPKKLVHQEQDSILRENYERPRSVLKLTVPDCNETRGRC